MPLNTYRCDGCAEEIAVFLTARQIPWDRPGCTTCGREMIWVPEPGRPAHVGALNWQVDLGRDGTLRIDTIQDANKLERDSLQRERNGEGQAYVLRALHQDRSNRDVPVLRGEETAQPSSFETQRGLPIRSRVDRLPPDWNQ